MLVLRALFWLALVSLFVPYKEFDLVRGRYEVDYRALSRQFHALIHMCETKPEVCTAAQDLARVAREEALRLAAAVRARDARASQLELNFDPARLDVRPDARPRT
jgi:hypothetical protein